MIAKNKAGVPETLFELVKHYSPTGEEADVVNWLVQHFRQRGFYRAYSDEIGNAIGVKGSGTKQIVFLGHIDTVPGDLPLKFINGEFWGRGAVDAKGPLAAFVDAVSDVEVNEDWQIIVIGAVGEEGDSRGAWFLLDQFKPDFTVIGEPSQYDRVTIGYKGMVRFKLCFEQAMAHHAGMEGSAGDKLLEVYAALKSRVDVYNAGLTKLFEIIDMTVIGMDAKNDGYSQKAVLDVQVRLPEAISPETWVKTWLAANEEVHVEIVGKTISAFVGEQKSDLARAFIKGIRQLGKRPAFVKKTGTADVNIVAPVWNCPAVVYGPGDSKLDHTVEERISIDDYEKSAAVIQIALKELGVVK